MVADVIAAELGRRAFSSHMMDETSQAQLVTGGGGAGITTSSEF